MVVSEIMSEDPFAVEVTESVADVAMKLLEADVRHLPVIEEGALVGMISDRDLKEVAPFLLEDTGGATGDARGRLSQPISEYMSSDVVSVTPEDDVSDVIDAMIEQRVGAVPVVEPDSSKLVGIVSYVDALKAIQGQLQPG